MDRWTAIDKLTAAVAGIAAAVTAIFGAVKVWPWVRGERAVVPAPPSLPPRPRILVVDDEPNIAEMIRQYLADDYEVRVSTSPYRALSEIFELYERDECYNLIVLDQKYAGTHLTGMVMAQIITLAEGQRGGCRTKIALLSGIGAILPKQKGIAAIWHKPSDLKDLNKRVGELLAE